jgi:hypothetical protein
LAVAASVVFVGVIVAILVIIAGSGDKHGPARSKAKKPSHATTDAKKRSLTLVLGPVVVQDTGFPTKVPPPVRRAVMSATQRYFDDAIQAPLSRGTVDNAYSTVFDAGVNGLAAHRDRETMTESNTGPIRGPVGMRASSVRIDGLGDPTGKLTLVATTFSLKVDAATQAGKLTINRNTELTFAYESGAWRVTAYQVTVRRSIGRTTTSTTARSAPRTTA